MEETMDGLDDEELEEEADEEVDKVLFELTDGKLGQAGRVGGELPVSVSESCAIFKNRTAVSRAPQLTQTGRRRGRGRERGRDGAHAARDARSPERVDDTIHSPYPFFIVVDVDSEYLCTTMSCYLSSSSFPRRLSQDHRREQ